MTEQNPSVPATGRRPMGRSPSYPAINLETAIRRARELYERERQHLTSVDTIATHWRYKSLNGPAHLTLAALKKFGLVRDEGKGAARRASLTNLAVDILENPDPQVRDRAIQQAALNPPIHRELWAKYGNTPPSDANLRWMLTRERGFTESGAADFIPVYKDTVAYAHLDSNVSLPTSSVVPEDHEDDSGSENDDDVPPSPPRTTGPSRIPAAGTTPYAIPIFNGRSVVVEGEFPLSEEDWNQFMNVLAVMKPALVVRHEQDRS